MSQEESWWEEDGSNVQGIPQTVTNTGNVFVTQGNHLATAQTTSAMIIVALVLSVFSIVCCGPFAIVSLIMGAVRLSQVSDFDNHPDHNLAFITIIISIIALVINFLAIAAEFFF